MITILLFESEQATVHPVDNQFFRPYADSRTSSDLRRHPCRPFRSPSYSEAYHWTQCLCWRFLFAAFVHSNDGLCTVAMSGFVILHLVITSVHHDKFDFLPDFLSLIYQGNCYFFVKDVHWRDRQFIFCIYHKVNLVVKPTQGIAGWITFYATSGNACGLTP